MLHFIFAREVLAILEANESPETIVGLLNDAVSPDDARRHDLPFVLREMGFSVRVCPHAPKFDTVVFVAVSATP